MRTLVPPALILADDPVERHGVRTQIRVWRTPSRARGACNVVGYNDASLSGPRAPSHLRSPIVYSREFMGFIPLALLPVVLGVTFILLAFFWPR